MIRKILITIYLICFPIIGIAKNYLCVPVSKTGFKYNEHAKEWRPAVFKHNNKYIVKSYKHPFKYPIKHGYDRYTVSRFGKSFIISSCKKTNNLGFINCTGFMSFHINVKTRRYVAMFGGGYNDVGLIDIRNRRITDENTSKPFIEIGKCSPL